MSNTTATRRVGGRTEDRLRYAAGALAYVIGVVHLFHPQFGLLRLVVVLSTDPGLLASDPRPLLFVLSGLAIVVGVPAVTYGPRRRERLAYLAGIVFAVAYSAGYVAWHLTGHGGSLFGREPLYHGLRPHVALVVHLTGDPWVAAAVVAETLLAVVLAVLFGRTG